MLVYVINNDKNYESIKWASENISIFINDQVLNYPLNAGAIITPELLFKENLLEIDTPNFDEEAIFGIFYANKIVWPEIAKKVLKQSMRPPYYKAIVVNKLNEGKVTSETYSLICPLSFTKLHLPARGKGCKHISCFELKSFLLFNLKNLQSRLK